MRSPAAAMAASRPRTPSLRSALRRWLSIVSGESPSWSAASAGGASGAQQVEHLPLAVAQPAADRADALTRPGKGPQAVDHPIDDLARADDLAARDALERPQQRLVEDRLGHVSAGARQENSLLELRVRLRGEHDGPDAGRGPGQLAHDADRVAPAEVGAQQQQDLRAAVAGELDRLDSVTRLRHDAEPGAFEHLSSRPEPDGLTVGDDEAHRVAGSRRKIGNMSVFIHGGTRRISGIPASGGEVENIL